MSGSVFDGLGRRKYLVLSEQLAFVAEARKREHSIRSFCLTLALTGARISEALALTPQRIDLSNSMIVFETLKRRKRGVFRAVPVPRELVLSLLALRTPSECRIWPWCRTKAWSAVKRVMNDARVTDNLCSPKALRHSFAVLAGQNGVPLNIIQRWLGHARIETTAIYVSAIGEEERALAGLIWAALTDVT